ncbi:hypothetical protein PMAYCL1PPCAC_16535, partial [Pristionchus mayeri]
YSMTFPHVNIAREAFMEFANTAFDEFRSLNECDKDTAYRTSYYFPGDMEMFFHLIFPKMRNMYRTLSGYTTFYRLSELDQLFEKCPDNIDKPNLIREVKRSLAQSTNMVRKQFESVKPSDFEFLSLYGLAFWSDKVMEHGEPLTSLANRIRSEIMRELHCYYATSGIADYASRVGHLFCLLVNCQHYSLERFFISSSSFVAFIFVSILYSIIFM